MNKKLTLGKDSDSEVGGVCAGLAEYFNKDVAFVRLLFVIVAFTSLGLLPYFIFWLALPDHPESDDDHDRPE